MVKVALDNVESQEAGPAPRSVKRAAAPRRSRWMLKLLVVTFLLVAAAPSILTFSGKADKLLLKFQPKLAEALSFDKLVLHWWAPVEVSNVSLRDLSQVDEETPISGAPLLFEADHIVTQEPLWRIALNAGRGTGVVVKSPQLTLIADNNGTNLDRTITALWGDSPTAAESSGRFPFRIVAEGGTVHLASGSAGSAASASEGFDGAEVTVSSISGMFSTMDTGRWLPEMKLTASISRQPAPVTVSSAEKKAASRPARLAAGLDEVVSDFPNIPLEDLAGADGAGDEDGARIHILLKPRADEKGRQTIQFGARDVDLRLLQPFLTMLGLDVLCDGVISGGIDARLAGASLSDGLAGRLKLQGDRIRIRHQGWAGDEWLPLGTLDASGAVAIADDGVLIQDLDVQSDVFRVAGSGEMRHSRSASSLGTESGQQKVEITGSLDLARLMSALRETLSVHEDVTVQSGRVTFALRGSADGSADVASNERLEETSIIRPVSAGPSLSDSVAVVAASKAAMTPDSAPGTWQVVVRTEELAAVRAGQSLAVDSTMRLDAMGKFSAGQPELSKARLTAEFGTIDCSPDGAAWKLSGLVQPAALWQQLQQFADVPQPGIRGDLSFRSRLLLQADVIQLTDLQVNSSDVKASSVALEIRPSNPLTTMLDGTIHLEGSGAAVRTLISPWHDASWLSDRASVVSDLTATPTREIQMNVRVTPDNVATVQRAGVLSVSRSTRQPVRNGTATGSSLVIDEADVSLSLLAKNAGQQFEITKGTVKLPGLVALVTGTVSVPESATLVDLRADTTYDLAVLSQRLFAPDSGLHFSGEGRDIFLLTGTPSALQGIRVGGSREGGAALTGSGKVRWNSANVWGLQAGPTTIQASLEDSLLRSAPIQCSVNGGDLNVMAQYDLATSRLQLGTGSRVQNLQVTPDLCRTWLGYVAPMLADTAQVSGAVSARVERFLWDFNVPENSDVVGQLTIHRAEAAAGSSLASLLEVVDLLRKSSNSGLAARTLVLPEQTIPIQVRQGFVSHESLAMELSGYRMTTSGAVGLNKQLQMTIDVPLEKSSPTAAGRSLRVPLRGTISRPQPDTAGLLQNLGTQKIQEKIGDEVDRTLNKQLNKLFDKF